MSDKIETALNATMTELKNCIFKYEHELNLAQLQLDIAKAHLSAARHCYNMAENATNNYEHLP